MISAAAAAFFGRWTPPSANLPGRKIVILGNHNFTRYRWQARRMGADASVMTLVLHTDPPLIVTQVCRSSPCPTGASTCTATTTTLAVRGQPVDQHERRADRLPAARHPHPGPAARQSARRRADARWCDDDRPDRLGGFYGLTPTFGSAASLRGPFVRGTAKGMGPSGFHLIPRVGLDRMLPALERATLAVRIRAPASSRSIRF